MRALIVEDEKPAQESLIRALNRNCPDVRVVGVTESVKDTVLWLRTPGNKADVIFMDVELQDGSSFEVLKQEEVKAIQTSEGSGDRGQSGFMAPVKCFCLPRGERYL